MIGEAAALAAACCWAVGSHLFGRIGRDSSASPGALNLAKCATAWLAFAITAIVLRGPVFPSLPARPQGWLIASGVVGLSLGDSAYFVAMALLGVRAALLLLSTAPVFAAVGGALWLSEPLGLRDAVSIGAVLAGVVLVVNERTAESAAREPLSPRLRAFGVVCGLGAGIGQATGSLMSRAAMSTGVSPLDTALVRLPAGVIGLLILATLSGRLVPWTRSLARPRLLAAIGGSALVGSYLGIWLSQLAIGTASSTAVASTLLATSPIFALPLGRWLNDEKLTLQATLGTLLACAGLAGLMLGKS